MTLVENSNKQRLLIISAICLLAFLCLLPVFCLEDNTDRPGGNYNNFALNSPDPALCEQACSQDSKCQAFTYVKPGFRGPNSQPECWLKNSVPPAQSNSFCVSGVKNAQPSGQAQQPVTALYRWYNSGSGHHFYTTDPHGESAPDSGYVSDGIAGYIITSQTPGTTALYRWFNPGNGDHFYTTDPQGELAQKSGYNYESITGYIWPTSALKTPPTPVTNIALYRWYNQGTGIHVYTTDPNEVKNYDYVSEGITGYLKSGPTPGTAALYNWHNPANGAHFYTTDPNGEDAPNNGYVSDGITGYIATSQMPGTTALYRWYNSDTGDHFYTTDPQGESAKGYVYDGINGYIWTKG
jgi:hypothetical protein